MWEHLKAYREFYLGAVAFAVFMLFFMIFGLMGFPEGKFDTCYNAVTKIDGCWCERLHAGHIKEPSNTWSNLGFVAVGLIVLWWVGSDRAGAINPRNRMTSTSDTLYPTLYGGIVLFMGPGSMLYHGSMTAWADFLDQLSTFMFVAFFGSYSALQLWSAAQQALGGTRTDYSNVVQKIGAGILFVVYTVLQLVITRAGHHESSVAIALFIGLAIALQVIFITVTAISRKTFPYDLGGILSFVAALAVFLLAMWLHANEAPGQAHCQAHGLFSPGSSLQAHALWQILAAAMTFGVYLFFRFEKAAGGSDG